MCKKRVRGGDDFLSEPLSQSNVWSSCAGRFIVFLSEEYSDRRAQTGGKFGKLRTSLPKS